MREQLSNCTAVLNTDISDPYNGVIKAGTEYHIEGYWDEITGTSWMFSDGNPAALNYAMRAAVAGLPIDNDVLYGKIGAFGFLIHRSEVTV